MRQPRHRAAIRRGDIRSIDSRRLHGIVGRLLRQQDVSELSPRQEWLFERVVLELERRWHLEVAGKRCSCAYCIPRGWLVGLEEPF